MHHVPALPARLRRSLGASRLLVISALLVVPVAAGVAAGSDGDPQAGAPTMSTWLAPPQSQSQSRAQQHAQGTAARPVAPAPSASPTSLAAAARCTQPSSALVLTDRDEIKEVSFATGWAAYAQPEDATGLELVALCIDGVATPVSRR